MGLIRLIGAGPRTSAEKWGMSGKGREGRGALQEVDIAHGDIFCLYDCCHYKDIKASNSQTILQINLLHFFSIPCKVM